MEKQYAAAKARTGHYARHRCRTLPRKHISGYDKAAAACEVTSEEGMMLVARSYLTSPDNGDGTLSIKYPTALDHQFL